MSQSTYITKSDSEAIESFDDIVKDAVASAPSVEYAMALMEVVSDHIYKTRQSGTNKFDVNNAMRSFMAKMSLTIHDAVKQIACHKELPEQDALQILRSSEFQEQEVKAKYMQCNDSSCMFCQVYIWDKKLIVAEFNDYLDFDIMNHYPQILKLLACFEDIDGLFRLYANCKDKPNFQTIHMEAKKPIIKRLSRFARRNTSITKLSETEKWMNEH